MPINAKIIVNKTSFRTLNEEIEKLIFTIIKKIKI